jgi:hypothetical protein
MLNVTLELDNTRLNTASCALSMQRKAKDQHRIWCHIFKTFKKSPKGIPCLDAVAETQLEYSQLEYCTDVIKAIMIAKVFKPANTQHTADLDQQLQRVLQYNGKESQAAICTKARNYINRLTALGHPPSTLKTVVRLENSIID